MWKKPHLWLERSYIKNLQILSSCKAMQSEIGRLVNLCPRAVHSYGYRNTSILRRVRLLRMQMAVPCHRLIYHEILSPSFKKLLQCLKVLTRFSQAPRNFLENYVTSLLSLPNDPQRQSCCWFGGPRNLEWEKSRNRTFTFETPTLIFDANSTNC